LADGLVVDGTVRCPWHHACFSVETGNVLGGPAIDPVDRWGVEEFDGVVRATQRLEPTRSGRTLGPGAEMPESVVIVGAGAAGTVAAAELRALGFDRELIVIDPDPDASVDRPNLSKDYLAGKASEEWIPLRSSDWWKEREIRRHRAAVDRIHAKSREIILEDGSVLRYGALILATGSEPLRLEVPGEGPAIFTLRTLADARDIIEAAEQAKRVAVLGASFMGLEVAASLRQRDIDVSIVAPEARPLERVMGPEVGAFVRKTHEAQGVKFYLERTARRRTSEGLELSDGTFVSADFIVMAVGVRPRVDLATAAGLAVNDGVLVDERLETSTPGVFAAGDIARYPDARSGQTVRIEHWVLAQRHGRTAARNAVGLNEPFTDVPFFWSQHYDVAISFVGHAPKWDATEIDGSFADLDVSVRYLGADGVIAMATVGRDRASLSFEAELEARATHK
jgi:NADPH-dependent 2,4-dienoyl-CoA reductase/sulfur reductase-like enzyme